MNLSSVRKIAWQEYLPLVLVMALAFYVAFIPHKSYPFPVHIDEWVHLAYIESMLHAKSITYADPFFGEKIMTLSSNLETGFHLFWATFHQISGISWLTIFRYFPGVILMITVLSVYVLGRRQGFGWEAAFFAALIPTTVGILGPALLVPVAMGLLFVPLALFLAFNFKTIWSYLAIFVFVSFLLTMHAPSGICLVIVLIPYILINLKGNFKHSLGLILAVAVPFLIPFPWIFNLVLHTFKGLATPKPLATYVDFPRLIANYGYLTFILCLLGAMVLALRGGRKAFGLVLGLFLIVMVMASFYSLHYGVPILYERGLMFMILMVGIVAGVGLMWVKNIRLPERVGTWLKAPAVSRHIGKVLCLALVVLTLVFCLPERENEPLYHMIEAQDYETFVWIEENVGDSYTKAIVNPWKATAFAAVTGKNVYTRIHGYSGPTDEEAYIFLENGCEDTDFLRENGISIVYSEWECDNPDLLEVRDNVYLLQE